MFDLSRAKTIQNPSLLVDELWPEARLEEYQVEALTALFNLYRVAWRSGHGVGKCVEKSEIITLSDGSRVTAGSLCGKEFLIPDVDLLGRIVARRALAAWNAFEPVFALTTETGWRMIRNGQHPFMRAIRSGGGEGKRCSFRLSGWTPLQDLTAGDYIAVSNEMPVFGTREIPDNHVKILAYLIGDGGLTNRSGVRFSQKNNPQLKEFLYCIEKMGGRAVKFGKYDWSIYGLAKNTAAGKKINPIMELTRRHGLQGHGSRTKFIPEAIFTTSRRQIAIFLSRLYSTDGWACLRLNKGAEIGYASTSFQLIADIKHLLCRFGIRATIQRKIKTDSWTLSILNWDSAMRFISEIGIYGKEKATSEIIERWKTQAKKPNQPRRINRGPWRLRGAPSGCHWEMIISVESVGDSETVAIEVPESKTFITPIYEHNTTAAALSVLLFMQLFPGCRVVTIAPTWRQVRHILWSEIHKWYRACPQLVNQFEILDTLIRSRRHPKEYFGLGVSTDREYNLEGFHADHVLVVMEESKGIPQRHFDAIEGALTTEPWRLEISTPGEASGPFYDAFKGRRGKFYLMHTSSESSDRVSKKWVAERALEWGRESVLFQTRVLGEFVESAPDQLITLSWFDRAVQNTWQPVPGQTPEIACDIARFGDAENVVAPRTGLRIHPLITWKGLDTMETAGRIARIAVEMKASRIKVDVVGLGAGVVDRLRELGFKAWGVNSAHAHKSSAQGGDDDYCANVRDAMWWKLRRRFETGQIAVPDDEILRNQLTSIKYSVKGGKIKIESKEEMGIRSLPSPDRGDAVAMAFWEGEVEAPGGGVVQLPFDLMAR